MNIRKYAISTLLSLPLLALPAHASSPPAGGHLDASAAGVLHPSTDAVLGASADGVLDGSADGVLHPFRTGIFHGQKVTFFADPADVQTSPPNRPQTQLEAIRTLRYYYPLPQATPPRNASADVIVYGATPGGITAAIQARRMHKSVILLEFGTHVGGMTASGLSKTDGGKTAGGIAREFYNVVGDKDFRPAAAEKQFRAMLQAAGVELLTEQRLDRSGQGVKKEGNRIIAIAMENGNSFAGKEFVDATYEGDLLAAAGVSFTVGRESNATYNETINGIQFRDKHQFAFPVDPYVTPGDPKSGLLKGIQAVEPGESGAGDTSIQAYNFRMFFSTAADRIPFPKPAAYDPDCYSLLARYLQAGAQPNKVLQLHEGDSNNEGAFSTDNIGMNYAWPEGDYATREKIYQDHITYQQGLLWFMTNDPRVPEAMRKTVSRFGLARGNFDETGGWPWQLYVREARRMVSDYVMTEHNCRGDKVIEDSVGLAEYTMDSHNCRRLVIKGKVRNEGDVQVRIPGPYPISYRSIVPKESECANLLVPVCLSSSHIAYGSIRMEPVFMVLGQSAGTAAALAIDGGVSVQKVDYSELRKRLLADKLLLDSPKKKP